MRRGNKLTLYELMQPKQAAGDTDVQAAHEAPSRSFRIPVGFFYIGSLAIVVLLIGVFALGYQRGDASVRSEWERDRIDSAHVEQHLQAIAEIDEPGGGTNEPLQSLEAAESPAGTRLESPHLSTSAVPARSSGTDPRRVGWNYYVIAHPSEPKVEEMVAFCRQHGLAASWVRNANGAPKVIVTPGFEAGGSATPEQAALRQRIREVGILWERVDPGHNADFSTRYAEKYQPRSGDS